MASAAATLAVAGAALRLAMASFGNPLELRFFPVSAFEEAARLQAWPIDAVDTARVDGDPVRLRARHIKRVHPAIRAEGVPRDAGTVLCGTSPSAREEDSSAKGTGGSNQSVR